MTTMIERTKDGKLYRKLLDLLRAEIEDGTWKVGEQIPTETALCGTYNVSRATVRGAIAELVTLGLLTRIQGKGTYVRKRATSRGLRMFATVEEHRPPAGVPVLVRRVARNVLTPAEDVRDVLDLPAEASAVFSMSVVVAGGVPFCLQKSFIPYDIVHGPGRDLSGIGFHEQIEAACGKRVCRVRETADVTRLGDDESGHIALPAGAPVLRVRQTFFCSGDSPLGFLESIYRTDRFGRTQEYDRFPA